MLAKGALYSECGSPILKECQYSWKVRGAIKQPARKMCVVSEAEKEP